MASRLYTSFGIHGTAIDWISSYLSGRSQHIAVGQACSAPTSLSTGVPQGSVLGPLFFTLYVSPIAHIVNSWGIQHQQYADDTQLFISIQNKASLSTIESCLSDLHSWFCCNGLALNPDKSDAIQFSTVQRARFTVPVDSVTVAGTTVSTSDTITTLGVQLDNRLSFNRHVNSLCKSCNFHIRALRHIRLTLTDDMAKAVATSMVSSRLDYCNSLLYGISNSNLDKLQRIQNSLARVVTYNKPTNNFQASSTSQLLHNLHWLPIRSRIEFKIALLTYKILSTHQPAYLSNIIHPYIPPRVLRSGDLNKLEKPLVTTNFGSRSFSVASPTVWNSLPVSVKTCSSVSAFKHHLKTYYFTKA